MPDDPSLPTVVTKAYDVLLWCVNHVGKFPRSHRFVLGERIETAMLDTVLLLVEASYVGGFYSQKIHSHLHPLSSLETKPFKGEVVSQLCIPRRRVTDTSLRRRENNRIGIFASAVETSRWDVSLDWLDDMWCR